MKSTKGRLTRLANEDERVREEDLRRLLDSQLSQQGQLWGFVFGILFGGILTGATAEGIRWVTSISIFADPVTETVVIGIASVSLVVVTLMTFTIASNTILGFKIRLMKDYMEARDVLTKRTVAKPSQAG